MKNKTKSTPSKKEYYLISLTLAWIHLICVVA